MAYELKSYDSKQVKCVLGAHTVTGPADDTFISIEPQGDGVSSSVGVYDDVSRSISHDPRHTIKITLQQTSRSNDVLSSLCDVDRLSGGAGAFPILITDLRGSTLFTGTAWVQKKANATFAKGIGSREWTLEAVGGFTNGGND